MVWVAGGLLAWRFQRSRVAAALLALAIVERGLRHLDPAHAATAWGLASAALPLLLLILVVPEDRGVFTPRGMALGGVVTGTAAILTLSALAFPEAVAGFLGSGVVDPRLVFWTGVPEPAALSFLAAAAVITVQAIRRRRPVDEGFLWTLVALILAFTALPGSAQGAAWLTAGGLILALAVVETSHAMAYHDELTGLPARRAFRTALEEADAPLTVAVVDVDHFKRFNDRHGHAVGDQVLRMVAARLDRVGGGGQAFRTGGEEFTLLFPGRRREDVLPHLESLRRSIAESRFTVRGRDRVRGARGRSRRGQPSRRPRSGSLSVTVSIGVAEGSGGASGEETVKAADRALYRAKEGGRNRVST